MKYDMYEVLDGIYKNLDLRKSIVPLFLSNPGLGKTSILYQFAKDANAKVVEIIASQVSPLEVSGVAMPDKELQKMIYYNYDKLESLEDGDIIFFDEIGNANPTVLNACLTLLESRKLISGKPLPNVMIVAAANPQSIVPMTPQMKERFVWYNVEFNAIKWMQWMFDTYFVPKEISSKLADLIKKEEFKGYNFYTPRSVDKNLKMIINDVPTPYETVMKPILETRIENKTGQQIILPNNEVIEPNEMYSWLKIIKLANIT